MKDLTTKILWAVYIGLLAVLLPHTAWLFGQFEPTEATMILGLFDWRLGGFTAWAGAFAFEAAIAALTHKLSKQIEAAPKYKDWWKRTQTKWLNVYAFGLLFAVSISSLANLAHSVEFGKTLLIFKQWGIEPKVYQLAFGGVLPVVSLLFAWVLSNVTVTEDVPNPELDQANITIKELRQVLKDSERTRTGSETKLVQTEHDLANWTGLANKYKHGYEEAEARATDAEVKLDEARQKVNELSVQLGSISPIFAGDKKERILSCQNVYPKLSASAIAIITDTSPSYVSEVLTARALAHSVVQTEAREHSNGANH